MEIAMLKVALSSINSALDIAKFIKNSGISLEAAETKLKLAELIGALADAKVEIASVRETILDQEMEIRKLKSQIDTKDKMVWEAPYYFISKDNGDNGDNSDKDGPYCQKCYDSNKSLIRLQSPGKNGYWECNECKSGYKDDTYKATISVVTASRRGGIDWSGY